MVKINQNLVQKTLKAVNVANRIGSPRPVI